MGGQWLAIVVALAARMMTVVPVCATDVDVCEAPQLPSVEPSSYGKDFFIAVPKSVSFAVKPELIIGTFGMNASYSVETAAGVIDTGEVYFDMPVNVTLTEDDIILSNEDRDKGIRVRATGNETVFVLVTTVQFAGFGDFLAYPCQSFQADSYEYFAVSTTSTSQGFSSQVILVACEDQTNITITPTETVILPEDAQDPESPSADVLPGSSHTVILNQMQTLLVATEGADLTGTKVTSNKPLTVISGHECGNVPESFFFCEQLAVQVPPTLTWGSEFLLAPFAGRKSGQYYKVLASDNDTAILYKCGGSSETVGTVLQEPGDSFLFRTESSDYCYLFTSKPVFVVQMATGGFSPGDNLGDPVMAIVPPIQQHVSSATFVSVDTVQFQSHAISVTVATKHFRTLDILFDGLPLDCVWHEIGDLEDCLVGFGCTMNVTSGPHTVSHSGEGGLLSVLAYGFDDGPLQGYAYLAGIRLQPREEFDNETEPDIPDIELPEMVPYYDLSNLPGLKELQREKDANSAPINIPFGLLFGDRIVTQAYVSENGVISFNAPWKFSHPSRFPPEYFYARNAYTVAPFWSDNDIRKEGTVRYVAFEKGDSAKGDNLLREVSAFLQGQRREDDEREEFEGTWMLVAQWDHVHPDPHGADDHMGIPEALLERTNTYQAVIVTDGVYSSNLFSYTCGDIEWSATGNRPAVVGYNAGGTYFENHRSSGFDTVGNDVSCVVELGARSKRQNEGMMTTVDYEPDVEYALAEGTRQCRRHFNFDIVTIGQDTFGEPVLPCPCSLNQAYYDPCFMEDTQLQRFGNKAGTTCFIQREPATGRTHSDIAAYGQQCCYDNQSALITAPPNAGTLRIYDYSVNSDRGIESDKQFYDSCCINRGGRGCDLFYAQRPIATCAGYQPPYCCAQGWGDPHYTDVAKCCFDFHGDGEFLLIEVGSEHSQLQGILKRSGGRGVAWHISFAFGEPGEFAYQLGNPTNYAFVLLKTDGEGTENGYIDITNRFLDEGVYREMSNRMTITRLNTNRIEVMFRSGLFFELAWYGTYGNAEFVKVHQKYTAPGESRGLMGSTPFQNCTEPWRPRFGPSYEEYCEYAPPEGSTPFKDWRVAPEHSMFAIHGSTSRKRRQISEPSLDFIFPDPPAPFSIANFNYTDEQREFCNNDLQCMFDLLFTGDTQVAMTTMNVNEESSRQAVELNRFPPNITGKGLLRVTVGEEAVYNFSVVDDGDTFTIEVVGGLPEGAVLEDTGEGEYTFRWILPMVANQSDIPELEFVAKDSGGAVSILSPQLVVCPCANGGECTMGGILNTAVSVLILNCYCPEAYSGDFCGEDRNGCAEIQCFEGVECLDVAAPGVGAMCEPCPAGYTGDGEKCFDLDECATDPTLCEQVCNNTVGSYECSCVQGYQLVPGTEQCEDVNECGPEGTNDCQQGCINTVGSYNCTCQDAFTLNADGRTCDADVPCAGNGGCSHTCAVIDGEEQCFCPTGYILHKFNLQTCIDDDECAFSNPCNHTCTNTFGSFECSCVDGYMLLDDGTSCGDVDECLVSVVNQIDLCPANTVCLNTFGSYDCVCAPGFELVDGSCQRIVEDITSGPEVQQVVPTSGEDNSHNFTVTTYSVGELTSAVLQQFRQVTAQAVNRYCLEEFCLTINSTSHTENVTRVTAEPGSVAIPRASIGEDASGNPVLHFYVQFTPTLFLTAESLAAAVEVAMDLYQVAGFFPRECNLTCPVGYELDRDCTGCELIDICLADNPCLNGGTCYLIRPPRGFGCDCPEAATGEHCEGAFTFINDTPKSILDPDGTTYYIYVEFSPGNGGRYDCVLREVGTSDKIRQPCNSFRADFSDMKPGGKYITRVIRYSGRVREVIYEELTVPSV